jgi:RND family efflux transporter MFP subunit
MKVVDTSLRSIAIVSMLAGCSGHEEVEPRHAGEPVAVRTEAVRLEQVPVTVSAVGTTEPYARATPGTRLLGRVVQVEVSEGQRVEEGTVLGRIENRDLDAQRQQAQSALEETQAVLANAENNVRRMRNLHEERAVPKQRLDEAETQYRRAQAGVAAAQGALQEVEANLGYSVIRSPLHGVVVRKFVQAGDMASPGAPLFTVEQQDPMKVVVEVGERDLPHIQVEAPVQVEVEALGQAVPSGWTGRVEAIVPSADPMSRTFQVKVLLDNPDGVISSGMFARVGFQKGERPGILVPQAATVRRGQLEGVYVVQEDHARLRWVRLGKAFGTRREVISGLEPGDRVVVSGLESLQDGVPVEVGTDG